MRYRRDIQGIRGIGTLTILFAHMGFTGFSGGYVMVDAFYVISGFVITGTLIAEHELRVANGDGGGFSLIGFYIRRLKRIFPMAVIVILVTVWAAYELWNPLRASGVYRDAWWSFFSAENINEMRKASDYFAKFDAHSPLEHYWSLAVEEQFYFVWPTLALLLFRVGKKAKGTEWRTRMLWFLGVVWVASVTYSIWFTYQDINAAYFSTFTRVFELASGAALAVIAINPKFQEWIEQPWSARTLWLLGAGAVTYSAIGFDENTWFPGYMALIPVLGSTAVIAAGINSRLGHAWVFDNPLLVYVGRISFSLYLWHWPAIMFMPALFPILSDGQGGVTIEGKMVAVGIAFALAVFSHILIERPVIRWHIGIPAALRRPARRGALVQLLRQSGSALGIAWLATALMLSSATLIRYAEKLLAGKVASTAITHRPLQLHVQSQGGRVTQEWERYLSSQLELLPSRATPEMVKSLENATAWPDTSEWSCAPKRVSCHIGPNTASNRILVIGDSHTHMWANAFRDIARKHSDVSFDVSLTGSCPNVFNLSGLPRLASVALNIQVKSCDEYHSWIRANARKIRPTMIVFSDNSQGYLATMARDYYIEGYVQFVEWAKSISPKVVILGAVPRWPSPKVCLNRDYSNVRACVSGLERVSAAVTFQRDVSRLSKVNYLETVGWLCSHAVCPLWIANQAVTKDGDHLNQEMSGTLAAVMWENMKSRI